MIWFVIALVVGLTVLVWSADKFVDGAAATAAHFGLPPLLIGMVVVGFGTSAPELVVSALAASGGNPGLALGNAYGSNIGNIALILGVTALMSPIMVHSQVLKRELPILLAVTAFAAWQLFDGQLSRGDAIGLMVVFAALMAWTITESLRNRGDALANEAEADLPHMPLPRALGYLALGLALLIVSSRALVWGAVGLAQTFGVSDLVIGLTIVAVGTSLPEFASSIAAARKGAHDLALGNIVGSNLFNTLVVVGLAGIIAPLPVSPDVIQRDIPVMAGVTLVLWIMCYGWRGQGCITRWKGGVLLLMYLAYLAYLMATATG